MNQVETSAVETGRSKLLLSIEDVAYQLSLSKAKVYAMAASGELSSVLIGRSRRIPAASLESFLNLHAV